MKPRGLTVWLIAAGITLAVAGSPNSASGSPVMVGTLSFEYYNEPLAIFSISNWTDDAALTGTLNVYGWDQGEYLLWTGGMSAGILETWSSGPGSGPVVDGVFDPLSVVRAEFIGTVAPFHLGGLPYVPVGAALGALPDQYSALFPGFTGIFVDTESAPEPIPEPASVSLLAIGAALLGRAARRRRRLDR